MLNDFSPQKYYNHNNNNKNTVVRERIRGIKKRQENKQKKI